MLFPKAWKKVFQKLWKRLFQKPWKKLFQKPWIDFNMFNLLKKTKNIDLKWLEKT